VPSIQFVTDSAEQTRQLGARLGRLLRAGDVVLLHGDLGSGKTTLAQGIARGLGVRDDVQSPTFTLVAEHEGRAVDGGPIRLYHLDLYRLAGAADLDSFGWEDYLAPADGVAVVEWPERAGSWLPEEYFLVRLEPVGADRCRLVVDAVPRDERFSAVLSALVTGSAGCGDKDLLPIVRDTPR
jgi:tRNA threonylcarbamoyladenosine biosynthesis protein TsaE